MKTFLKIVLVVVVVLLAIKLLPVALAFGAVIAAGLAVLAGVGIAILVGLVCAALALVVFLSPLWLLVLAVAGLIALLRRSSSGRATA
jgi:hypothetical protein